MMDKLSSYVIIYIVGVAVLLYFMVILPGKRKNKKVREMHSKVKVGDEVSTIGGIIGKVTARDENENTVTILIDENTGTTIKVVVLAIQTILTEA